MAGRILEPGEVVPDVVRLDHWPIADTSAHAEASSVLGTQPDPHGHYPADPRALSPGMTEPMMTVVHSVDGRAQAGVTLRVICT